MRAATIVSFGAIAAILATEASPAPGATAAERYVAASIDSEGQLVITRTGGERVVVGKAAEQTTFSSPVISPARTAVAAEAMFSNCCTSYDLPLQVVAYAGGKLHRFAGVGLPISRWGFADSGTRIAYGQEPVHFGCFIHYELRDIASERLMASTEVPEPCGQNPNPATVKVPRWVVKLSFPK